MSRFRRAVTFSFLITVPLVAGSVFLGQAWWFLSTPWLSVLALVLAVAEFWSVVVALARLRVDRQTAQYRLLGELSAEVIRAVLLNQDENKIFATILDYTFRILGGNLGSVLTFDEEGYLTVAAFRGFDETYVRRFRIRFEDTWQYRQTGGQVSDALIITAQTIREAGAVGDNWSWPQRSLISAPLFIGGRLYGLLNVDSYRENRFRDEDLEVMRWFRAQIEVCLLARDLYKTALADSRVDGLTQFLSRSAFDERFHQIVDHCDRYGEVFTLGMFDVDGLKSVNDNFGHGAGDQLLKTVCEVLKQTARKSDLLGRYGGDEFVALFHSTDAQTMAERSARLVGQLHSNPPVFQGQILPASFSYGFADFPGDGKSFQDLVAVADQRLYQTKSRRPSR